MRDAYGEFEAASLFCPRCRRAVPVRRKLLLVLPTGNKYDYVCQTCGTAVGAKTDDDATAFRQTAQAAVEAARRPPPSDGARRPRGPEAPRRLPPPEGLRRPRR
jgi:hypothetical protein